jgi:hypothetical protein
MSEFKFLREYVPPTKKELHQNVYVECFPNGERIIFFEIEGILYRQLTIPEDAPTKSVLDIVNLFVYEIYDSETVDTIVAHLEIFFRNF